VAERTEKPRKGSHAAARNPYEMDAHAAS
jgi:hypothetical protein